MKFSEIDLNISDKLLKLQAALKYSLTLDFKNKVDNNTVQAKWFPKSKKMRIIVNKI